MNSNTKIIVGILAAGAVGVAVGMLLAPAKGSDTRKAIKDNFSGKAEGISTLLADLISQGKQLLEDGKDQVAELRDEAKDKALELKSDYRNEVSKIKSSLS